MTPIRGWDMRCISDSPDNERNLVLTAPSAFVLGCLVFERQGRMAGAGTARALLKKMKVESADRTLGLVLVALKVLRHDDLIDVAGEIVKRCGIRPTKPVQQQDDAELRKFLQNCAVALSKKDPVSLAVIENHVDRIGRARLGSR